MDVNCFRKPSNPKQPILSRLAFVMSFCGSFDLGVEGLGFAHRPLSSSFLGLGFRV